MKIAFILPKLANQGPIIVAKDIIDYLVANNVLVDIYYFDNVTELDINCNSKKQINFFDIIDFEIYDVVHSHMFRPDIYVWYHRKKHNSKTIFISTLHQNIFDNLKGNYNSFVAYIFEKIWIRILGKQDIVVTLTDSMQLVYKSKLATQLKTIYNGRNLKIIDNGIIDENDSITINRLKQSYKIIGSHCLLTKRKGIHQIVHALVELKDYALIVVGNGKELQNLIDLANKLGVIDRCFFCGYKSNATSYLKYFDIYIMSSYSEGFPLGLLEAGMSKIPIVCSDLSIFRELFLENQVVYYELDNICSLTQSIMYCYKNKINYSNSIFDVIEQKYSNLKMVKNYYDLYSNNL